MNRVAMVARVAPAPNGGFAHDHERGDLVEALFIQSVLNAVPWPDSCQRESEVEA